MALARSLAIVPFLLATVLVRAGAAQDLIGDFPVVQVPAGNPLTPAKILLGKALFFEEQLSSDDTMACATCHMPEAGGGDPRASLRAPGEDGVLFTPDDDFGSAGMRRQDAQGNYLAHALFGFGAQPTARNSPTVLGAAFFNTQFWDARALPVFTDLAGAIVLPQHASLETQAVEPPVSGVEMAEAGRGWDELTAKLARVRPLDLAVDVPPALEDFLDGAASYGPLFRAAFGTPEITRERIGMALASYERTLIPDQTPFDLGTLSARQQQGLVVFRDVGLCEVCHPSANRFFSDGASRTVFLPDHRRVVKTPTLRNVGLRRRYMSSGQFTSLDQVLEHYENAGFIVFANEAERVALLDFLAQGLTDPRAAQRAAPFDRPLLRSEVEPRATRRYGTATAGSGGFEPEILADTPANLGSESFRIGLGHGLGGAPALLLLGPPTPSGTTVRGIPVYVEAAPLSARVFALNGSGPGTGGATFAVDLPRDPALIGTRLAAQWFVLDPAADHGVAVSAAAEYELFSRAWRRKARRH